MELQMLAMVATLLSADVHDKHCWAVDKLANGITMYRHGSNLREITPDKVEFFNGKEPKTDWTQVWLMDLPKGGGVILAGYDGMVCSVGHIAPPAFSKTVEELEGGRS